VCVTVASTSRRVDLALPSGVPLVELLPALARCVEVLDDAATSSGLQARTADGQVLRGEAGLMAQGVRSGDIVTLAPPVDAGAVPPRYDDPAEVVAVAVGRETPWDSRWRRMTSSGGATLLLVAGAGLLVSARDQVVAAACASAVAAALLLLVVLRARGSGGALVAVTLGYATCLYAAAAALCWGWHGSWCGPLVAVSGGASAAAGCAVAAVVHSRRLLLLPVVAVGAVGSAAGIGSAATGLDMAPFLTSMLAVVVLTSDAWPALALSVSGAGRHALRMVGEGAPSDIRPVDLSQVAADVAWAREILVSTEATAGLLLVALAPAAVSIGPAGAAVPVLGSFLLLLRARRCHTAVDAALGVAAGVGGLTTTAVSTWFLEESWRLAAGVLTVATGLVTLAAVLDVGPRGDSARLRRTGDLMEGVVLGALLPALLVALALSWARP
jgi:hypothetical protein